MKKQIVNISLAQTAKIMALLLFTFMAIICFPMAIVALFSHDATTAFALMLAPFFYLVFSYIVWLIYGWFYNLLSDKLGGIEFELRDVESTPRKDA